MYASSLLQGYTPRLLCLFFVKKIKGLKLLATLYQGRRPGIIMADECRDLGALALTSLATLIHQLFMQTMAMQIQNHVCIVLIAGRRPAVVVFVFC